ncbi:MAG: CapA family protein [Actinomycetota bacterium]|nr:CapA family protein [Actinomycetota bacterium]
MRLDVLLACVAVWCAGCSSAPVESTNTALSTTTTTGYHDGPAAAQRTASIVLLGDVMLGRSVAPVVMNDRDSIFERLRATLNGADLALANLESPLTERPHMVGDNALEADPRSAPLLAGAGFDGMAIANNHAGDAGPETTTDTIAALHAHDIAAIGAGATLDEATTATVFERNGVRIAVLAFDLTHGGPSAGVEAGVATWDSAVARSAVAAARATADVVVVGIHGGVEYLPEPDPVLAGVVADLTSWGVDIVWGNGAHVAYAVSVAAGADDRQAVQAPGLGNAVFDQRMPRTQTGTMLEVLVSADGVQAWRTASIGTYLRATFDGWDLPTGDAASVDGEWWSPIGPLDPAAPAASVQQVDGLVPGGVLIAARLGDVDGDGVTDVVASYRRPFRTRLLQQAFPDTDFIDASGRGAHLGVFEAGTLRWGAGTMTLPVETLDVCDDGVALGFSALDDPTVTAGSAWRWRGFGFATASLLDGHAVPICVDLDLDGRTEPALLRGHDTAGSQTISTDGGDS